MEEYSPPASGPHAGFPPAAVPLRVARRILLVEDQADTARAMFVLLRRVGYDVRVAVDAADVLRRVAAERFDLVVSDIGLPGTDGYELMRQLRDRFNLRGVALSGYGGDAAACRDAGYSTSLVKPVGVDQLDIAIRHYLPD